MQSIWSLTAQAPEFPVLEGDIKTDVLIIGGGIAGILTARFLQDRNVPYVLVEKNRICSGTTGCTTAKITFQHGLNCRKIAKNSVEKARLYVSAHQAAFQMYQKLCADIDCDYETKDNFVYSRDNPKALEGEMKALSQAGFEAKFCDKVPLPIDTVGAVCFPGQAQLHPLKFLFKLAQGLNIYERSFVREMKGRAALTDSGRIRADRVVVATHFPFINKHGSYFLKQYQHRSYVLALENAQDVNGMYVDENRQGLSFRNYRDFLLLGGGGHRTGKKGGGWRELRLLAARYYPHSAEKYYWAAQDCMSLDDMPYIGQYSSTTANLYTASGFNKWGMTGAMLSAMLLSDIITGRQNDYLGLFSPSRSVLKPQLLINSAEALGGLLRLSAKRCPHMGCALQWNKCEHSWDCPCHGSRFAPDGQVLDNPANGNIEP